MQTKKKKKAIKKKRKKNKNQKEKKKRKEKKLDPRPILYTRTNSKYVKHFSVEK